MAEYMLCYRIPCGRGYLMTVRRNNVLYWDFSVHIYAGDVLRHR